ncbi:hypothetical protein HCH_02034 [Hahella chejuensis KCTC 2396]|uniref:Uncharacterized protein n=1 Tax=Hahella chejuensis (strain KCTC 2396) TaxID=349521 RepID=Q2SKF5_HAHCH|nr:hypothetical protein HCH_02034 [Hahella chejuensis KCTC 2396]
MGSPGAAPPGAGTEWAGYNIFRSTKTATPNELDSISRLVNNMSANVATDAKK